MTGNLEKPLGLPSKKPLKKTRSVRGALIGFALLATIAIGYVGKDLVDQFGTKQIGKDNQNQQSIALSDTESKIATPNSSIIRKRPDLAIDDKNHGMRELHPVDQENIPTIIPRKRPNDIEKRQILAHLPDFELIEKTGLGSLPKVSPDGLRPLDVYSRQADTSGNFGVARIVIIVGGLGISQTSSQQAIDKLPAGVTLAFAPQGNSLSRWMQSARKRGHELLLQIPMEPFGYPQTSAGENSLLSSADDTDNIDNLHRALARITNYVGVINFLGGKLMTSPNKLAPIFDEISSRGLMFVDDGTVRNSMAPEISKSTNLPFTRADIHIDQLRTRAAIQKNLKLLESQAKRTGLAIGVASAFPDSISQIAIFLNKAKQRGIELTPVSAIATEPKG